MTEQERKDFLSDLSVTEPPAQLAEVNKEYNERCERMMKEVHPHALSTGGYDLEKVNTINGKDVKALDRSAKLSEIHKEMKALGDLKEEGEHLNGIWNEKRRLARAKIQEDSSENIHPMGGDPKTLREHQKKTADRILETVRKMKGTQGREIDLNDVHVAPLLHDIRATLTTTGTPGFPPEVTRTGFIEFVPYQMPNIRALFPEYTTSQSAVKYIEEGTEVLNTRTIGEGTTFPEDDMRFAEKTANIEKVGTTIHVTEEQLEDEPQMRSIIEMKLFQRLARKLDNYFIHGQAAGSGSPSATESPIFGGLDRMGTHTGASGILTVAKDDEISTPNALHKACTDIESMAYANCSAFIMHPTNWHNIRTQQTADGIYLWGAPSDEVMPRVWGRPVVINTNCTVGTAFGGDFMNHAAVYSRVGVSLQYGYVDKDFTKDLQTIKIRERLGIAFFRPKAFVKITGLPTS